MTKKEAQRLLKQLNKLKEEIGRDRDELRELIYEWEGLKDSCESAYEHLECAADALSEYV